MLMREEALRPFVERMQQGYDLVTHYQDGRPVVSTKLSVEIQVVVVREKALINI